MGDAGRVRHALREPMVWLVIALPLAVVIAGFVTLYVSIRSGNEDAVRDPVRRTAQIQTAELGADEAARRLGLSAVLSLRERDVAVLPVAGSFDRAQPLKLVLAHPVQAAQDRELTLAPVATGWSAPATIDAGHDWNIELSGGDPAWRLRGRLKAGERAAHLAPALPAK